MNSPILDIGCGAGFLFRQARKKGFDNHAWNAGMCLLILASFYFALIFADYASIRFRSGISVLLICLVTVSGKYMWKRLMLPKFII